MPVRTPEEIRASIEANRRELGTSVERLQREIAVLTGNVVLVQGRSEFRGARAELDMKKGISRLLPAEGERVRTII